MREQPHYTNLLTKQFFDTHYVQERRSYPELREMLLKQGFNIHIGTLHKYAKKFGIGRNASEAKINIEDNPLDYSISYSNDLTVEYVDGFLLGDGSINYDTRKENCQAARYMCALEHQEFCMYLLSGFGSYLPVYSKVNSPKSPSGINWQGYTRNHPDIYQQLLRWYPLTPSGKRVKYPPQDIKITPLSVILWYLGDGSIVQSGNTVALRLSTDGFAIEGVEFLVQKLKDVGITCHRNGDNRIYVEAKGIPKFFEFIGTKSPVKCYDYKFDVPEWRLASRRMSEVAEMLNVSYQRLAHLVKIGQIPTYRASIQGKPRFLEEHIEACRKAIKEGSLY